MFYVTFQGFCSSAAGVYNELLLKRNFAMDINVQNVFLYSFDIFFNTFFLYIFHSDNFHFETIFHNYSWILFGIILIGAAGGFTTALILKYLNIILKEYANSVEMLLTALLASYYFGTALELEIIISIAVISLSIYLYSYEKFHPGSS